MASKDEEGFHFVATAPRERGEKQRLAAITVGMTGFVVGQEGGRVGARCGPQ